MKRAIVVLCLTLFLMMSFSACQAGEEPLLDEDELRELEVRVANDNCRWTERWLIEDQELIDEMISLIVDHVQVLRPYASLGFIFGNINVLLDEDRRPYAPAVFFQEKGAGYGVVMMSPGALDDVHRDEPTLAVVRYSDGREGFTERPEENWVICTMPAFYHAQLYQLLQTVTSDTLIEGVRGIL